MNINLLNDLIVSAIEHGSDGHGWYNVNKSDLEKQINALLYELGLEFRYEVVFDEYDCFLGVVEKNLIDKYHLTALSMKELNIDNVIEMNQYEYDVLSFQHRTRMQDLVEYNENHKLWGLKSIRGIKIKIKK